jgi:hypothetical protein
MSPSWETYGPTGAALGVALFGGAALYSLDPAFAQASDMQSDLGRSSATSEAAWSDPGGFSSSGGGGGCGGG